MRQTGIKKKEERIGEESEKKMKASTFFWICVWAMTVMFLAVKLSDFYVIYNKQLAVRLRVRDQDLAYTQNNCEDTNKVVSEGTVAECNERKDRLQETPSIYALHDYMSMKKMCDEEGCKGSFINFTNRPLEMITAVVIIIAVVMVIAFLCIIRSGHPTTIPMVYASPPIPQQQPLDQKGFAKAFSELFNSPRKEDDFFGSQSMKKKMF